MSMLIDPEYIEIAERVLGDYAHERRWLQLRDQLAARLQDTADEFFAEIGEPSMCETTSLWSAIDDDSGLPKRGPL